MSDSPYSGGAPTTAAGRFDPHNSVARLEPMLTPDQDHALRSAAVWEARRWEAAMRFGAAWRSAQGSIDRNAVASVQIAEWALEDTDALIAAYRAAARDDRTGEPERGAG